MECLQQQALAAVKAIVFRMTFPPELLTLTQMILSPLKYLRDLPQLPIYGTRANAGVIIITTRRGKAGKTKVNLSQELGYNQAVNLLDFANWDQTKIDTYFGGSAQRTADLASGRDNDWEDMIYGEQGFINQYFSNHFRGFR